MWFIQPNTMPLLSLNETKTKTRRQLDGEDVLVVFSSYYYYDYFILASATTRQTTSAYISLAVSSLPPLSLSLLLLHSFKYIFFCFLSSV